MKIESLINCKTTTHWHHCVLCLLCYFCVSPLITAESEGKRIKTSWKQIPSERLHQKINANVGLSWSSDPLMRTESEKQRRNTRQTITANPTWRHASSCRGNGGDLSTLKWIQHKGQSPHAGHCQHFQRCSLLCRLQTRRERLESWRDLAHESSVISDPPVSPNSCLPIRAHARRYPILHLCHSQPADQQSNFTQACTEAAHVGMRIFLSTRTRRYLKYRRQCKRKRAFFCGVRL